jgi:hypothetical protein
MLAKVMAEAVGGCRPDCVVIGASAAGSMFGSESAFLDGRQLSHCHGGRQGEDSSLWLFVGKRKEMTWLPV